jgi:EAL domain-containing protein (putative c-di-GMP-specific phosphodiesterase class I)
MTSSTRGPAPRERVSALQELQEFGQSCWLDDLGRSLVRCGQLARLVLAVVEKARLAAR